ncbi:hypothetical protein CSB93_6863 (plasmid) [Pseudomonas paraeruginosa]|uniref:Uncharacterized protein n=2 Tax=Pseudomonas aeruginosa group TaxID=136841 RepID=A0A2L1KGD3_PSEAI|nr:Hypothetical protein [Pseudomonas aeruginosa]AVK09216.1 hypothetical protein CSB93_6863 [Pseudomonas paraeruginosa]UGK55550.1 Hypothetical protein [Pseudomonas aeruginosa]
MLDLRHCVSRIISLKKEESSRKRKGKGECIFHVVVLNVN